MFGGFCPKGLFGKLMGYGNSAMFLPYMMSSFGVDFWLEKGRIWTSNLQGNGIPIYELDVRILNHPNRTSRTQVMVRFLGVLQAALFWLNLLFRFWD